jgi:phage tail sheath protein FI
MAPSTYFTPGVFIEEVSSLPPSVAEIGTAIPAFVGTTANHKDGNDVVVYEISSLREYEDRCGRSASPQWKVVYNQETDDFSVRDHKDVPVEKFSEPECLLWYAIDHYFRNGGSRCYVVSVGGAIPDSPPTADQLCKGLITLKSFLEPTLVVIPEATKLQSSDDYGTVCKAALQHAEDMMDRFVLLDAKPAPGNALNDSDLVSMREPLGVGKRLNRGALYYPFLKTTLIHHIDEESIQVNGVSVSGKTAEVMLKDLAQTHTNHYNRIKRLLADQRVILPPSAAVAGVVASVDRERGVWKAPANVSLQAVVAPVVQLTDEQHGRMNNAPSSGKSINAIRSFPGKGVLVWGARTLDGNGNDWRYISVRRLFITIEEAVKRATEFAVFEPNDMSTWLKVKGMIDSYLYRLWERGALRGSRAEEAYVVSVGLGKTMTQQDILEGRLKVEIGLAAVRPAEFIILSFSHKLAQ